MTGTEIYRIFPISLSALLSGNWWNLLRLILNIVSVVLIYTPSLEHAIILTPDEPDSSLIILPWWKLETSANGL